MLPEPVDDVSYENSKKKRDEKKQLADQVIELNQIALDYWGAELQRKNAKATAARAYLDERGITAEIQKAFRIGYSPDSWNGLLTVLRESGADEKAIVESGLVSVNEEKERTFDRFRGRIMFSVLDVNGRPIAFGARAMGDDQPKYLNSPETPAYTKGEHLYGLFQGKDAIRKKGFAILVEGYLDLIALAEFGITNVAASLGTAFTPEQSKLLNRFTQKVVINYDGDSAGVKAARRAIEHLLPQNFDVKVLVLPDGKDPDDFIRENGVDAYNDRRGKATPFLRFALDASVRERNLNNAKQKAEAIEEFLPLLLTINNSVQRRESFDQAMTYFRVDDPALKKELWSTLKSGAYHNVERTAGNVARIALAKVTIAERRLLGLLTFDRELRDIILPTIERSDYDNLATADLFAAYIDIHNAGNNIDAESLLNYIGDDESAVSLVHELLSDAPGRDQDEVMDAVRQKAEKDAATLRYMAIDHRIDELSRDAVLAEQTNDSERIAQLTHEQLDLRRLQGVLKRHIAEL